MSVSVQAQRLLPILAFWEGAGDHPLRGWSSARCGRSTVWAGTSSPGALRRVPGRMH